MGLQKLHHLGQGIRLALPHHQLIILLPQLQGILVLQHLQLEEYHHLLLIRQMQDLLHRQDQDLQRKIILHLLLQEQTQHQVLLPWQDRVLLPQLLQDHQYHVMMKKHMMIIPAMAVDQEEWKVKEDGNFILLMICLLLLLLRMYQKFTQVDQEHLQGLHKDEHRDLLVAIVHLLQDLLVETIDHLHLQVDQDHLPQRNLLQDHLLDHQHLLLEDLGPLLAILGLLHLQDHQLNLVEDLLHHLQREDLDHLLLLVEDLDPHLLPVEDLDPLLLLDNRHKYKPSESVLLENCFQELLQR
jgi:hypothetical protein